MLRIALFSDVHGNILALDAVLADIGRASLFEEAYCLGDVVGYGPRPTEVIDRLRSLDVRTIRGNYDQGIGDESGSCGCHYSTEQARSAGAASYEFTSRVVSEAGKEWLLSLPTQIRIEERGVSLLLTHGSPRKINEYLTLDRTDVQLARLAVAAQADVVCVGHVHVPYHRAIAVDEGFVIHYVSSGSVGKPKDGDSRACWVELWLGDAEDVALVCKGDSAAGPAGASEEGAIWAGIVVHRVPYDVEAVVGEMLEAGLPSTLARALRTG
ncbi:MAG: metallophosphatase family protein [Coriobacteriia bacterium]|nr:metallophosphatase family protein [Coriobacteriia bacterium]